MALGRSNGFARGKKGKIMAPLPKLFEKSPHDNDNRPRVAANAPGSSFKRFVPGQFEVAEYLIKDILPSHGVVVLGGQYRSGKTFLAMDIGMHLIHGEKFLGRKTKLGAILWIAAEGAGIVEQRLEAARLVQGWLAA